MRFSTYLSDVGGIVGDPIKINALEGNIAEHGAHAEGRSLQDVVLANLQQAAIVCQTPHSSLQGKDGCQSPKAFSAVISHRLKVL